MTGGVVNYPRSHTSLDGDTVNTITIQSNNTNLGDADETGDVINDQPRPPYDDLYTNISIIELAIIKKDAAIGKKYAKDLPIISNQN